MRAEGAADLVWKQEAIFHSRCAQEIGSLTTNRWGCLNCVQSFSVWVLFNCFKSVRAVIEKIKMDFMEENTHKRLLVNNTQTAARQAFVSDLVVYTLMVQYLLLFINRNFVGYVGQ